MVTKDCDKTFLVAVFFALWYKRMLVPFPAVHSYANEGSVTATSFTTLHDRFTKVEIDTYASPMRKHPGYLTRSQ